MTRTRVVVLIWTLIMAFGTAGAILGFLTDSPLVPADQRGSPLDLIPTIAALLTPTIGCVIVARQPRNTIGWAFVVAGAAAAVAFAARGYARTAVFIEPSLGGKAVAGWLADLGDAATFAILGPVLLLLFPDGKPLSRRWRPVVAFGALSVVAMLLTTALAPGPLENLPSHDNPFGVDAFAALVERVDSGILLTLLAGLACVVLRFRRSRGTARQQLKWLVYVVAVGTATSAFWSVIASDDVAGVVIGVTLFVGTPAAAGLAVLRYRLYDVDRIITRTLTYAAVTAVLAAAYLGIVVVFQRLLPVAGRSDLAVAMSTLTVAALFTPARRRIQSVVNRRFNRASYDAARTAEAFAARLREETDIDTLVIDLEQVVHETMQPATVSVWTPSLQRPRG